MKILYSLICLFLLCSCSSTQFKSNGKVNLSSARLKDYEVTEELILKREFYLWGTLPQKQVVDLDELLLSVNHLRVAETTVDSYRIWQDYLYSIISFGFYTPIHYKVTFKGLRYEE